LSWEFDDKIFTERKRQFFDIGVRGAGSWVQGFLEIVDISSLKVVWQADVEVT
jgi:hypothetical protein